MSHFYGTLEGSNPPAQSTRCGHKSTGLTATAASWKGCVQVTLKHNETTGEDTYEVYMLPWKGVGETQFLAKGVLGKYKKVPT